MKANVRVVLCGLIGLLAADCSWAQTRRPQTGVVGTFGTLNSTRPRQAPSQASRGSGGRSTASRKIGPSGGFGGGGAPAGAGKKATSSPARKLSGGGGGTQGSLATGGQPGVSSFSTRRSTGRLPQSSTNNLSGGQRQTTKRVPTSSSIRSSLPPANWQY